MDRVEFLNSISYRDDFERSSMLEYFWDQYMALYTLVDNIEHCEVTAHAGNSGVIFTLRYIDSNNVDKLASMIEMQSNMLVYDKWYLVSYSRPTDANTINICIQR